MSGEIRYSQSIALTNKGLIDSYNTSGLTGNQTNPGLVRNVQEVTTDWAGEGLSLGGVTNPRMALFSNMDPINFVEVGVSISGEFYGFLKLKAGQQAGPLWLSSMPAFVRANTAPVKLFYIMYEE